MSWTPTALDHQHHAILRLAFEGLGAPQIAEQVGLTRATVACILRSPLAQAELARLHEKAEDSLTNIPLKARLISELNGAAREALKVNRDLMNNGEIDPRVRAGVARHFLDRMVFGDQGDNKEGSYREILRSLDRIEGQTRSAPPTVIDLPTEENGGDPHD